jgi:hypothetical protein
MATVTRAPSARRADVMRDALQRAGGYAAQAWGRALPPRARALPAQAFRRTLAFMAAHPPLVQGLGYGVPPGRTSRAGGRWPPIPGAVQ